MEPLAHDRDRLFRVALNDLADLLHRRGAHLAVDLRPDSPTFLRWLAVELDDQSNRMFYIPPGFAHGFATLGPRAQLFYKCSAEYDPQLDSGIRWNDPTLAIPWPIDDAQISAKDNDLPLLDSDFFRSLRW